MSNSSNSPLGRPRILFVDDSRLFRATAVKMFSDDFDLVLAEDGLQAWDMINSDQSIKVVFTDLVMPKLDGFEFLDRVRTAKDDRIREMPVIVVTDTDGKTDAKERAFQMGATDFVAKPFDATDINVRTQAHLRYQSPADNLSEKATLDAETGLLNRTGMINLLEKDVAFCLRYNKQLFMLHIEIDEFKELFIRIGRKNAEMIIDQIAHIISEEAYQRESVARLGLSSFAISMPGADPDSSLLIAHRVTQIVNNFCIKFKQYLE